MEIQKSEKKSLSRKGQISILVAVATAAGVVTALVAVAGFGGASAGDETQDKGFRGGKETHAQLVDEATEECLMTEISELTGTDINDADRENPLYSRFKTPLENQPTKEEMQKVFEECGLDIDLMILDDTPLLVDGASLQEGASSIERDILQSEIFRDRPKDFPKDDYGSGKYGFEENLTITYSYDRATSELTVSIVYKDTGEPRLYTGKVDGCALDLVEKIVESSGKTEWGAVEYKDFTYEVINNNDNIKECVSVAAFKDRRGGAQDFVRKEPRRPAAGSSNRAEVER